MGTAKKGCRAERNGSDKQPRRDPPMGHPDYPLLEFASRLASVEEKYAKEIQGLVECFCGSRLDLPVKKLEELSKSKIRTAKCLKKLDSEKRGEFYELWKLCNVYSVVAVDVDNAMRDIRSSLRKRIRTEVRKKDPSPFRKMMDEYRPANKPNKFEPPSETYDNHQPVLKDKGFLSIFSKRRESRKVSGAPDVEQTLADTIKLNYRSVEKRNVLPPKPPPIASVANPHPPSYATLRVVPNNYPVVDAPVDVRAVDVPDEPEYMPQAKLRSSATREKVEESKRLSMPGTLERMTTVKVQKTVAAPLPPVAPPRKEKQPAPELRSPKMTSYKTPTLPPRPKDESWKRDMNKVAPTVIQLDGRNHAPQAQPQQQFKAIPLSLTNPFLTETKIENATNIQVEDAGPTIPPSPQTTIRVGNAEPAMVPMSPKVSNSNGKAQKFQSESVPGRPVQQARIVFNKQNSMVDRF